MDRPAPHDDNHRLPVLYTPVVGLLVRGFDARAAASLRALEDAGRITVDVFAAPAPDATPLAPDLADEVEGTGLLLGAQYAARTLTRREAGLTRIAPFHSDSPCARVTVADHVDLLYAANDDWAAGLHGWLARHPVLWIQVARVGPAPGGRHWLIVIRPVTATGR